MRGISVALVAETGFFSWKQPKYRQNEGKRHWNELKSDAFWAQKDGESLNVAYFVIEFVPDVVVAALRPNICSTGWNKTFQGMEQSVPGGGISSKALS